MKNKSLKKLSFQRLKNWVHIFFGIVLFIFACLLIHPDFKILKKKVFSSGGVSGYSSSHTTIENTTFDGFKIKFNNSYNKDELKHIKKIEIDLIDGKNYDYLNEMENLETLIINDYSTEVLLDNIDGSIFKNKMNIEIYRKDYKQSFTKEKFKFLKDIPYIENLKLGEPLKLGSTSDNKLMNVFNNAVILNNFKSISYNIDSEFLESLDNVHNLNLAIDEFFRYNYKDLSFLDSLYLNGGAYDVAIYFSNEDLENLKNKGVDVKTNDMDLVIDINNRINYILNDFNFNSTTKTIDKIDSILSYVLNNASYDEELKGVTDVSNYNLSKFYNKGYLKGFLDNDSQICGNYASILNVLLNRSGINSYLIDSQEHIWNIVEYNDNYYYLDATWIDGTILRYNNTEIKAEEVFSNEEYRYLKNSFEWYLLEPEMVEIFNLSQHTPTFIPADLDSSKLNIKLSNSNLIVQKPLLNIIKCSFSFIALILSLIDIISSLKYDKKLRKEIKEFKTFNQNLVIA